MNRFLLLIVALILLSSLSPWRYDFGRPGSPLHALVRNWPADFDQSVFRDATVNVALYFPLGAIGWMAAARRHGRGSAAARVLAAALALSAGVECLQYYDPVRVCSLFDVTTNGLGTAVGAAAAVLLRPRLERWRSARSLPRDAAAGGLLFACWVGYQLYPPEYLMPAHGVLHAWLARFTQAGSISPTEIWANAAEWLAAAMLLEAVTGRSRVRWLLAAMLFLPLRLMTHGHRLAPEEPLGAALAVSLCVAGRKAAFRARAAWMLMSAIALRELEPFHFSRAANAFVWIPFRASLDADWHNTAFVLWRKAYDYGAAAFLLRPAGQSCLTTGAILAGGLALCETAQLWLPGRAPETTDSALALGMGFALFWLAGRETEKPAKP